MDGKPYYLHDGNHYEIKKNEQGKNYVVVDGKQYIFGDDSNVSATVKPESAWFIYFPIKLFRYQHLYQYAFPNKLSFYFSGAHYINPFLY